MTEPLKPCPFCNGTASVLRDSRGFWFIACSGCKIETQHQAHVRFLMESWNRRAVPASEVQEGPLTKWLRDEAWSWLRRVLSQGGDIQLDYAGRDHERYSMRLDGAARERRDELAKLLSLPPAAAPNAPISPQ